MSSGKDCWGWADPGLMALTGWMLLKDLPPGAPDPGPVRPGWLVLGLGLMLAFVGCEALCSRLILGGWATRPYRRCLGYSFVGFYVSSITPSSTGGQPAQVYYMSKDGIPAAHGALNMMLIAVCYQVTVVGYALAVVLSHFSLVANLGGGLCCCCSTGGWSTAADGGDALPHVPAQRRPEAGGGAVPAGAAALVRNEDRPGKSWSGRWRVPPGGGVRQANPGLVPVLLGLTFSAHRPVRRARGGVPRLRPHRQQRHEHHLHPGPGDPGGVQPAPARGGGGLRGGLCGRHGLFFGPPW